jgi:hypothetical protein
MCQNVPLPERRSYHRSTRGSAGARRGKASNGGRPPVGSAAQREGWPPKVVLGWATFQLPPRSAMKSAVPEGPERTSTSVPRRTVTGDVPIVIRRSVTVTARSTRTSSIPGSIAIVPVAEAASQMTDRDGLVDVPTPSMRNRTPGAPPVQRRTTVSERGSRTLFLGTDGADAGSSTGGYVSTRCSGEILGEHAGEANRRGRSRHRTAVQVRSPSRTRGPRYEGCGALDLADSASNRPEDLAPFGEDAPRFPTAPRRHRGPETWLASERRKAWRVPRPSSCALVQRRASGPTDVGFLTVRPDHFRRNPEEPNDGTTKEGRAFAASLHASNPFRCARKALKLALLPSPVFQNARSLGHRGLGQNRQESVRHTRCCSTRP